jgi:hypothetical protein
MHVLRVKNGENLVWNEVATKVTTTVPSAKPRLPPLKPAPEVAPIVSKQAAKQPRLKLKEKEREKKGEHDKEQGLGESPNKPTVNLPALVDNVVAAVGTDGFRFEICLACRESNDAGYKFCAFCGVQAPVTVSCRNCKARNLPSARFCCQCGGNMALEDESWMSRVISNLDVLDDALLVSLSAVWVCLFLWVCSSFFLELVQSVGGNAQNRHAGKDAFWFDAV